MQDITKAENEKAAKLRARVKELRTEQNLSQAKLAEKLRDKYKGSWNQLSISKIEHTGEAWKEYSFTPFPKLETLILVADYFEVDLGYLLGETDYKSFDDQKASEYLRINSAAAKALEMITRPKGSFMLTRMLGFEAAAVLEKIFPAKSFGPLLNAFNELDSAYNIDDNLDSKWDALKEKYGEVVYGEALTHVDDCGMDGETTASAEVADAACEINKLLDECYGKERERSYCSDVARYGLLRAFENLVDELYPEER